MTIPRTKLPPAILGSAILLAGFVTAAFVLLPIEAKDPVVSRQSAQTTIGDPVLVHASSTEAFFGWAIETADISILDGGRVAVEYINQATNTTFDGAGTYDLVLKVLGPGVNTSFTTQLDFERDESITWETPFTLLGVTTGIYTLTAEGYLLGGQLSSSRVVQVNVSGEGGNDISGYEVVASSSPNNSESPKEVVAACPDGKRVLGGGAKIDASESEAIHLVQSYPSTEFTWLASAIQVEGESENWQLTAFAICALLN